MSLRQKVSSKMLDNKWTGGVMAAAFTVFLAAGVALAEPLLTMEAGAPKAGVVTAWSGKGKKVELTLQDGADANAVAAAIESNVDRVRTKVKGGKVLVIGKTEADLLKAIAGVELGGGEDDMGLLAAAALEDDIDSGSSLRAKKTAQLEKLLKDRATVAQGKVTAVKPGNFPHAAVTIRILSGPTGALGKQIRKGKTITFRPRLAMKAGQVDLADLPTQTNLGAYFLEAGDRVKVKVGAATKDGFEALLITR